MGSDLSRILGELAPTVAVEGGHLAARWAIYLAIVVGAGWLLLRLGRLLAALWRRVLRPHPDLVARYGRGSCAFVTGATGGIGGAFCAVLAEQGFDIALCGRSADKLKETKEALESRFPERAFHTVLADLSGAAEEGFVEAIVRQIDDAELDVSMLVNVAGAESVGVPFTHCELATNRTVMVVNMFAPALLMHTLIERLARRSARSAIINVGAGAGKLPFPGMTVYGATKAFLLSMSIAVSKEYETNVDVLSVNPLGVSTAMLPLKADGLAVIRPEQCARAALKHLGAVRETAGSWSHAVQAAMLNALPDELRMALSIRTVPMALAYLGKGDTQDDGGPHTDDQDD